VPSELEQSLAAQTSKLMWPASFGSGSSNVAVRSGVAESTKAPSAGVTSEGSSGAMFAVLFVIEMSPSEPVAAALPVGRVRSRTIGSLPGFVYASVRVSR
jgi:hypothetical protein